MPCPEYETNHWDKPQYSKIISSRHLATIAGEEDIITQVHASHFHDDHNSAVFNHPAIKSTIDLDSIIPFCEATTDWRSHNPLLPCVILDHAKNRLEFLIDTYPTLTIPPFTALSQLYPDLLITLAVTGITASGFQYASIRTFKDGWINLECSLSTNDASPANIILAIDAMFRRQCDRIQATGAISLLSPAAIPPK